MDLDPFFHRTESIRIASRDGSAPDFAEDSTISPEKIASLGITVPFTNVATASFASTFVPTVVLPAVTLCLRVTGNSSTEGRLAGLSCASRTAEQRKNVTNVRIDIYGLR